MAFTIGSIKPGVTIVLDNELYIVVSCELAKLARGSSFCRAKLKNMRNQSVLEKTLRDSDNIQDAFIEKRKIQFSYKDGHFFHFLDVETFEDLILNDEKLGDIKLFLKENLEVSGIFYNNELISLELPLAIELEVIETDPGFKGDTVKAGLKPAKLETGATIQVPLFINIGDKVKVDTQKKEYLGRAS